MVLLNLLRRSDGGFLPAQQQNREEGEKGRSLSDWLWGPFHKPSAVFGLTAADYRRRDEIALIQLVRRLSYREFPDTEIHQIDPDDPEWSELLFQGGYQSICLVGRLGLYGQEALERWNNPNGRFGFLVNRRPGTIPAGQLDKDFHCIYERIGEGPTEYYRTEEKNGKRTDFALVQRYPVYDGTRYIVVVIIAGASSLGTLAAAQWAADKLTEPTHPYGEPIDAPQGVGPDSHFEALVDVTAEVTTRVWRPLRINLRRLCVDRAVWCENDRRWHIDPPRNITILREKGTKARAVGVLFDGKRAPLNPGSQTFRLLVEACLESRSRENGVVNAKKLGQKSEIWDGKTHAEADVRRRLSILKQRYLGDALSVGRPIRLDAKVTIRDENGKKGR